MLGKRKFKRVLFILIVKCFNKHTYHILYENPSSLLPTHNPSPTFSNCCPTFLYSEFQGITEGFVFRDSIQCFTTC